MRRLSMVIDNPKMVMAQNNIAYLNSLRSRNVSTSSNKTIVGRKMDLSTPMLDRIVKARTGCGGCGGAK
jgi:hypothetical protein